MQLAALVKSSVLDAVTSPSTKFKLPRLPAQLLSRLALRQQLAAWHEHRLTIITAPAGYGKTTLAAAALQDTTAQIGTLRPAWLALDEDDDDPVRFVHGLSMALAALIPQAAAAASIVASGQQQPRPALQLLLAALEQLPAALLVVLDDYHRLQSPEVHQLLALALERSPDNLHWLVLSRRTVPFALGRLRLEGQVLELDSKDLRLSRAEMEELLASRSELHLDAAAVDLLEERTQGWMAGVQLVLLSLRRQTGGDDATAGANTLLRHLRGDNALLSEYLTGEVLAHIDAPMRRFLLHCSILERLHPDLCTAVTGMEESAYLLQQAVEQQLFVRVLDVEGEWCELHHLFRDLLLRRLHQDRPAAQVQALHRRAADWWLAQGDVVAALRTLLAGGAAAMAAALVQARSHAALLANQLDELRHWLGLLPQAEIDAHPRLLLDQAWLGFLLEDAELFAAACRRAQEIVNIEPRLPVPLVDELAALDLLQQLYGNERQGLYNKALSAAAKFDAGSHLAHGWALVVALLMRSQAPGAPVDALSQQVRESFRSAGFLRGEIYISALQAGHLQGVGDGASALKLCNYGLELASQAERSEPGDIFFFAFTAGELLYWQDRRPEAALYFQRTLAHGLTYRDPEFILLSQCGLDLCRDGGSVPATGAAEPVPVDEDKLWHELGPGYTPPQRAHILNWQMWRNLKARHPQEAWRLFQRLGVCLETLPPDAPDSMWLALLTAYVAHGRQLEELSGPLQRLIERSRDEHRPYIGIRAQLLHVWQFQQLGRRDAARSVLRRVLHDIEHTGYVRMVLDLPNLLHLLHGAKLTSFGQDLLQQIDEPLAQVRLTPQELETLHLFEQGLSSAQVAEKLVVTVGTVYWRLSVLYRKLGVKNRAEALAYVRSKGML